MKDPNKLTIADYRKALRKIQPTPQQVDILREHARETEGSLAEMGESLGLRSSRGVATSYGKFARQIGWHLDNSPKRPGEKHYWMELICAQSPNKDWYGQKIWIIRDRFVKALEAESII